MNELGLRDLSASAATPLDAYFNALRLLGLMDIRRLTPAEKGLLAGAINFLAHPPAAAAPGRRGEGCPTLCKCGGWKRGSHATWCPAAPPADEAGEESRP